MGEFSTPSQAHQCEIEIKRSRFICHINQTKGVEAAKAFIHKIKNDYPDARHHCYAYIANKPSDSNGYGFSDYNEPSGTAGMPIFTHLKHSSLGETTIVVVRYFGGVKLGTGGLARAYGDAAEKGLSEVKLEKHIEMQQIYMRCEFSMEDNLRRKIESIKGQVTHTDYQESVLITANIPKNAIIDVHHDIQISLESTI